MRNKKNTNSKPASRPSSVFRPQRSFEPEERNETSFTPILLKTAEELGIRTLLNAETFAELLAPLDYAMELTLKQKTLERFWQINKLPGVPGKPVPAPMPRHYRTTSKRRGLWLRNGFTLCMGYGGKTSKGAATHHAPLADSLLEPAMHNAIYREIRRILRIPHYEILAKAVNYCILRGNYDKCTLIVNIASANGPVIRKLKMLTEELKETQNGLNGCFMYLDESRSEYYLESQRPANPVVFKKIFGPEMLDVKVNGTKLLYPPTVFSQVNEAMLPLFAGKALELLKSDTPTHLLDLYCGYGLFGLLGADNFASVTGMDMEGPAISAAIANAAHLHKGRPMKYIASQVSPDTIESKLPLSGERREVILLDPPRHGTANGVLEALLARRPEKVLHIFCGADEIPRELKIWTSNGYQPKKIIPFDMFAGSANLETMILLERP